MVNIYGGIASLRKKAKKASRLFSPLSDEDFKKESQMKRGGDDIASGEDDNNTSLSGSMRSEVKNNRDRSVKNTKRISVIDERTAWMMRLLMLILGAVLAGEIIL